MVSPRINRIVGCEVVEGPEILVLPEVEPVFLEEPVVVPNLGGTYPDILMSLRLVLLPEFLRTWGAMTTDVNFNTPVVVSHCFHGGCVSLLGLVGEILLVGLVVRETSGLLRDHYGDRTSMMRVLIQNQYLGAVIGRGGTHIWGLEYDTGTRIRIDDDFIGRSTERVWPCCRRNGCRCTYLDRISSKRL